MEEDRKRQEAAEEMIRQAEMEDEAKKKAEEEERLRKEEEKKREVIALEEEKKRLVSFLWQFLAIFNYIGPFSTIFGLFDEIWYCCRVNFYWFLLLAFYRNRNAWELILMEQEKKHNLKHFPIY